MIRREFTKATKKAAYERSRGICGECKLSLDIWGVEYHHKDSRSNDNSLENCLAICIPCHRRITKELRPLVDKATRIREKRLNITGRKQKIPSRGFQRWP